jgi:SpoVK/Ycf46/Vps4 family AAA+-type ATPase
MIFELRSLDVRILVVADDIREAKEKMKIELKRMIEKNGIKLDELLEIEDENGNTWICFAEDWLKEMGIGFDVRK